MKKKLLLRRGRYLLLALAVCLTAGSETVAAAAPGKTAAQAAKTTTAAVAAPVLPTATTVIGRPENKKQLLLARNTDGEFWQDLEVVAAGTWLVNGEYYLPLRVLSKQYPLRLTDLPEKGKSRLELRWREKSQVFNIVDVRTLPVNPNTVAKPPLLAGLEPGGEVWIAATVWTTLTGMETVPTEGASRGSLILNSTGASLRGQAELDPDWQMTARPRVYGYRELTQDLVGLRNRYPDVIQDSIGKSSQGASIPLIKIGSGAKEVFISGAWHGEEWITAQLLANFTERLLQRRQSPEYQALLNKVTLYIAPMINPDGCEIAAHWDDLPADTLRPALRNLLPAGYPPREWRANAQGYDLNNQFPIHWDRTFELTKNRGPAVGVAGPTPLIAPESRQVYDFTLKRQFVAVFCYHSQGEVIYWQDDNLRDTPQMRKIASLYAQQSGYWRVDNEPLQGGYRDWFVANYHRPGLTVEVGRGENPLPIWEFPAINERNQRALLECLAALADD